VLLNKQVSPEDGASPADGRQSSVRNSDSGIVADPSLASSSQCPFCCARSAYSPVGFNVNSVFSLMRLSVGYGP
jgi:hypothetical protein